MKPHGTGHRSSEKITSPLIGKPPEPTMKRAGLPRLPFVDLRCNVATPTTFSSVRQPPEPTVTRAEMALEITT
jgi:hypothetical protein